MISAVQKLLVSKRCTAFSLKKNSKEDTAGKFRLGLSCSECSFLGKVTLDQLQTHLAIRVKAKVRMGMSYGLGTTTKDLPPAWEGRGRQAGRCPQESGGRQGNGLYSKVFISHSLSASPTANFRVFITVQLSQWFSKYGLLTSSRAYLRM